MSNQPKTLEEIKQRRDELADKRSELEAINQEEQDLEYQEFSLKMKGIEVLRTQSKAFENDMATPQADLVLLAYVGSKTTRIDLKNETVRNGRGLDAERKNIVAMLATYMRNQANIQYALLTDGKNHLLARYNDEQRKAVQMAIAENKQ